MNALSLFNIDQGKPCIPTGSNKLDEAIGNGIRLGTLTELAGPSGCGKTQMCLKLAFNTILPKPVGIVDGGVVYISTKKNFHPLRVNQLAEVYVKAYNKLEKEKNVLSKEFRTFIFTKESALERILHHKLVLSMEELIVAIYEVRELVASKKDVSTTGFLSRLEKSMKFYFRFDL